MWNFIWQNAGIILFILVMVFMHRHGGVGGCCGGGHQHGPAEPRSKERPREQTLTDTEGGSLHRH